MKKRELRGMLERHPPPRPDDALGRRVLTAAQEANRPAESPTLGDRLWFSRPARLGWAAALILLVVAQVVVAGSVERQLRRLADPQAQAIVSTAEAAARELGLEPGGSMRHVPTRRSAGPSDIPAGLD